GRLRRRPHDQCPVQLSAVGGDLELDQHDASHDSVTVSSPEAAARPPRPSGRPWCRRPRLPEWRVQAGRPHHGPPTACLNRGTARHSSPAPEIAFPSPRAVVISPLSRRIPPIPLPSPTSRITGVCKESTHGDPHTSWPARVHIRRTVRRGRDPWPAHDYPDRGCLQGA